MGENGCVAWMFQKQGVIEVEAGTADEDQVFEVALEAGASDMSSEGDIYSITTPPAEFETVKSALEAKGIVVADSEVSMVPQSSVELEGKPAEQMLKLMESLEDHEDVQNVYANFDIDDAVIEKFGAE
jgi:transcriptional/translational regulatory protein YebC/TACO1